MKKFNTAKHSVDLHDSDLAMACRLELQLNEVSELLEDVTVKLKKIDAMADSLLIKTQISHSMIVIRKVGEDRLEELNKLLD